ncbi:hypothetical protein GDO81_029565, partial [Engystomops pustulosus]
FQSYPQPGLQYMPGQQIYAQHPQGVVVQQAPPVAALVPPGQPPAMQQPDMGLGPNNIMDLPPPSPPKPKTIVLPPHWKTARDPEGKIYYYHVITRQTQWDPPSWDSPGEEVAAMDHEAEMDLGTPTYDENPMKVKRVGVRVTELRGQGDRTEGSGCYRCQGWSRRHMSHENRN